MSNNNENREKEIVYRDYAIDEYVPKEGRYNGAKEMFSTWVCANANPTSWYMGCTMGAMGIGGALLASLVGNPIIYLILALVGFMGFRVGSSTMGLARASFGISGSKLPSAINAVQFVGWCGVNTYIAASPLSDILSGIFSWNPDSAGMTVISVTIIIVVSGLIAVCGGARIIGIAQNIAVVCLVILSIWLTIRVFTTFSLSDITAWTLESHSENLTWEMSFGAAVDMLAAFGFAWIMAVADYTRYAKTTFAATGAPMLGATFGMFWFCMIGAVSSIAVAVMNGGVFDPNTADLGYICTTLGMGKIANILIVLSTIAVNLINIYSGGFSTANISEKFTPKKSMVVIVAGSFLLALTPLVLGSFLDTFQIFLGYLGAVFPPCIAILIVDYYIIRKKHYDIHKFSEKNGPYWYSSGINWYTIVCWAAGVAVYFICGRIAPLANSIGAVLFCFIFTGILYYVVASIKKDIYK